MPHHFKSFALIVLWGALSPFSSAEDITFEMSSDTGERLPCRIHLTDDQGKAYHPPNAPFWRGGFVCDGSATLELAEGRYHYEIERGPEWSVRSGTIHLTDASQTIRASLSRIADLKEEGWFGGDLHVHRQPDELPLHLEAEDLSVASVQTWWNKRNLWGDLTPQNPVKEHNGRHYDILGGEDERGGGAILYHRMNQAIDITQGQREFPASTAYLRQAKEAGCWAEIEKPFWWDTPLWLATGQIDSVGLAHNHMNRSQVLGNEAWGRPRDQQRFPGVHGNALYTQDLYYKILNTGLRLPPSAGSASGVLPNPVGYNRVYVHLENGFTWDRWWDGLRRGRSFVTNGPLLRLKANEALPGEIFQSNMPLQITIDGAIDSRDAIATLELVQNGVIEEIHLPATLTIDKSGWFLVRAITRVRETFRFASTAPWHVEIGGQSLPPDEAAASYFLQWAQARQGIVEEALKDDDEKRQAVVKDHAAAVDYWKKKVAAAAASSN